MNTALMFSSKTNEWATPARLFADLDAEFHFDLDPCATPENAKCRDFYSIDNDGLTKNWGGAACVLQSSLWAGDRCLGPQMQYGGKETGDPGCYAHTRPDRHGVLPRLHLREGPRNSFPPWAFAFQRWEVPGSVPVYDSSFLIG